MSSPLAAFALALATGRIRVIDLTQTLTPEFPQISLPPEFGQCWPFRIEEVSRAYVGDHAPGATPALDLADPVRLFERGEGSARPLPPFFLTCGTADPLLDDTRRLHAALTARGAVSDVRYYPGEPHAFHAFVFRESAQRHWRDTFAFLDAHVAR